MRRQMSETAVFFNNGEGHVQPTESLIHRSTARVIEFVNPNAEPLYLREVNQRLRKFGLAQARLRKFGLGQARLRSWG